MKIDITTLIAVGLVGFALFGNGINFEKQSEIPEEQETEEAEVDQVKLFGYTCLHLAEVFTDRYTLVKTSNQAGDLIETSFNMAFTDLDVEGEIQDWREALDDEVGDALGKPEQDEEVDSRDLKEVRDILLRNAEECGV